jgi:hypothetical protein
LEKQLGELDAIDCPGGMARCEAGEVHVTRTGRIARGNTVERCPTVHLGTCRTSCVEDTEAWVIMPTEFALEQLCNVEPLRAVALGVEPLGHAPEGPQEPCEDGEWVCRGDQLLRCDGGGRWRTQQVCVWGCVPLAGPLEAIPLEPTRELARARGLLCRHRAQEQLRK